MIRNSDQIAMESFGRTIKFSVPVVANGNDFFGVVGALNIFELTPVQRH